MRVRPLSWPAVLYQIGGFAQIFIYPDTSHPIFTDAKIRLCQSPNPYRKTSVRALAHVRTPGGHWVERAAAASQPAACHLQRFAGAVSLLHGTSRADNTTHDDYSRTQLQSLIRDFDIYPE